MLDAANLCCQDKLVLRVRTANDEVAHLQNFDYGEFKEANSHLKSGQHVPGHIGFIYWCNVLCSCHKWAGAA